MVTDVEYYGHDVRYELSLPGDVTLAVRTQPDVLLERGARVAITYGGDRAAAAWTD